MSDTDNNVSTTEQSDSNDDSTTSGQASDDDTTNKPTTGSDEEFSSLPKVSAPDFIDTGVCRCSMRNDDSTQPAVWRCVGNKTMDIGVSVTGKWFKATGDSTGVDLTTLPEWDATYPPDYLNPLVAADQSVKNSPSLVPWTLGQDNPLNMFDEACTGINATKISAKWYRAQAQVKKGNTIPQLGLCWNPSLQPIPMQNASSWHDTGCNKGFVCPNNTINALPAYCPPNPLCGYARLQGMACTVQMGDFEPLICQPGFYCPHKLGNASVLLKRSSASSLKMNKTIQNGMLKCPSGHFCPTGSYEPIKCGAGSVCPAGAQKEIPVLPLALAGVIDIVLIISIGLVGLGFYVSSSRRGHHGKPKHHEQSQNFLQRSKTIAHEIRERHNGYRTLDDETEMGPYPHSTQYRGRPFDPEVDDLDVTQLRRQPSGFSALVRGGPYGYPSTNTMEPIVEDAERKDSGLSDELQQFVASMQKCMGGTRLGLSFAFKNLRFQPKGANNPILSDITGYIGAGSLVGILGGSGAGKSTFVNVLMGKQSHTGGAVTVNGGPWASFLKKVIGYVPQDDIVLPELTVRENILHSARMRLPQSWSDNEIQTHVDTLIECLELAHVSHSLVGSPAKPVISGGQRKRVSIGMELAGAPMALFLDEPTSGLDATSASSIMTTLKALSRLGITVVTIIHQPRQEIFESIDDLILLGNGKMIYQGKTDGVQEYFEHAGYKFPSRANPADILMDIITGQGRPYKLGGNTSKEALIESWVQIQQDNPIPERPASTLPQSKALKAQIRTRGARFHKQLWYCFGRATLQQYRNKSAFWFEVGVASLAGFLIGLAQNANNGQMFHGLYTGSYANLSPAIDYKSVPIMALLVAISIGLIGSAPGTRVFGEEKLMYFREAAAGHSRLAYYLGKVISTIPRMIVSCLHFTGFFMILATPMIGFGEVLATNLLYIYCIYGLASCVSMISRREDGPLLATMASLIVGVLSGMAPQLSKVKSWHLLWLWDLSPGTWLAEAYFGKSILRYSYLYNVQDAAERTGFNLDNFTLDLLLLLVIGTVYRLLAFGGLVLVKRSKQR